MQIMPTIFSEPTSNPYMGAELDYQDDSSTSFADEMARQQAARDAVDSGEAHSVEVALEPLESTEPLTQAPYSLTSNNGVTYTADEVLFTKQELRQLLRDLQDKGAPAESLEELSKLASQPDGATLHQVLSSFYNQRGYQDLSDTELSVLKGLANKIDPSGKLAEELLIQANGVNGKDGEKFINTLLASMDNLSGKRIDLNKTEMSVIAKAAGLSEKTTASLMGGFGPYNSLQLNKTELNNILSPAIHEFAQEDKNLAKLDKALDETLGPILSEARARMQKEAEAHALSIRSVEQSKVVIEKTVLETVNQNLENARSAQSGNNSAVDQSKLTAQASENKQMIKGDALNNTQSNTQNNANIQSNANAQNKFSTKEDLSSEADDNANAKKDNHLNNMLNKAEVRTMAQAPSNNINTPVIGFGAMAQNAVATEATLPQTSTPSLLSQQAASQVEKAMLSAAADGTKRLNLQLHPAELGALTITLTSRNGELNALIRSEKPETTELLHKQLDYIRTTLEQQGLKVDKLEVQTQTSENNSQYEQWDGMQEHNARQEENSRRDILERLRNLGKVRNDGTISTETTLEQHVQLDNYTAVNAGQPLHIVA